MDGNKFYAFDIIDGTLHQYEESKLEDEFNKPGVYGIILNDKQYIYIGQSGNSMFDRICEHIGNLSVRPKSRFGIFPNELKNRILRLSIVVLENKEDYKKTWKEVEKDYIKKYQPLIQHSESDICLITEKRREAIIAFKEKENLN